MDRHKCARPECRETFTGEKPEGWMSLEPVPPMRGTILFFCPVHSEHIKQQAYQRMLMEAEPEARSPSREAACTPFAMVALTDAWLTGGLTCWVGLRSS